MTESVHHDNSDTKLALLNAAQQLFGRKGYAAVSTREIAEQACVNLGSIQYHFGSKAHLFVATIRNMMEASGDQVRLEMTMPDCGTCVHSSSVRLAEFIKSFLRYLLTVDGSHPCRMMIREIFSETSEDPEMFDTLVSTMSDEFMKPVEDILAKHVQVIKPGSSVEEVAHIVRSIIGQCTFFATHRPFQERLMGVSMSDPRTLTNLGMHVTRFSLRALGVDGSIVDAVVTEIF